MEFSMYHLAHFLVFLQQSTIRSVDVSWNVQDMEDGSYFKLYVSWFGGNYLTITLPRKPHDSVTILSESRLNLEGGILSDIDLTTGTAGKTAVLRAAFYDSERKRREWAVAFTVETENVEYGWHVAAKRALYIRGFCRGNFSETMVAKQASQVGRLPRQRTTHIENITMWHDNAEIVFDSWEGRFLVQQPGFLGILSPKPILALYPRQYHPSDSVTVTELQVGTKGLKGITVEPVWRNQKLVGADITFQHDDKRITRFIMRHPPASAVANNAWELDLYHPAAEAFLETVSLRIPDLTITNGVSSSGCRRKRKAIGDNGIVLNE